MALITAHDLKIQFLDKTIFDGASFSVEKGDRIGLIGVNGAGKTTLFRLITGELEPTDGSLTVSTKIKTGTVEQHTCSDSSKTAAQEMLSVFAYLEAQERQIAALTEQLKTSHDDETIRRLTELDESFRDGGGLTFRSRADAMLTSLGFTEEEKSLSVASLSGGQRTKIALGKLLLSDADLILLDEPTNHLDLKATASLEDFLSKYPGTFIVISHDRYFLDRVTNKTVEIDRGRIFSTKGAYTRYMELKAQRLETERREFEKKEKEIKRIESMIEQQKRFNQERNYVTIASKQKQIDRIEKDLVRPDAELKSFKLKFECLVPTGNDVLFVSDLTKNFTDKPLINRISFNIYKTDRVFIIGENGCGKSTLLKMLAGKLRPDGGIIRFGANVRLGYFEQIQSTITSEKSVIEDIYDAFPGKTISELRGYLGAFGFRGYDIDKKMRELSGGERARIELLKLMLKKPNVLLLDEPTNHLDIRSREVFESALDGYDGTLICVSHDRYLINKLSRRLFVLSGGEMTAFDGGYDDYAQTLTEEKAAPKQPSKQANEYVLRKQKQSDERKRRTKIQRIEARLEELSKLKDETGAELNDPENAADYKKMLELTAKLDELSAEENDLTEQWLELQDE